jgi:23S rRNA (cytosine1962-C5)-methyltransferase
MILNRLKKNLKKTKPFLNREKTESFRLYDQDIPEYPYVIDVYGDEHVIIWPRMNSKIDEGKEEHFEETLDALSQLFKIERTQIHIKGRFKQKGLKQYEKIKEEKQTIIIKEMGLNYLINLTDYLDTGLFMDHRPFRKQLMKSQGNGKNLLNLFCYTSSISVAAASAGYLTTNVDLSNTYLEWSKENFGLNEFPTSDHLFIKQSAVTYLQEQITTRNEENIKYDLIFLDPPTFSNSKSMDKEFEVEQDHVQLITNCMLLLKSDGILYFSNNKKSFKLAQGLDESYQIKDISAQSIPQDFRDKKIHQFYEIRKKL